ncbi:MAG: ATP-binding protein [Bacteroidota bacterium]
MTDNFAILEKYNFWGKKPPASGIIRAVYLGKIRDFLGTRLIKVLVGQRRSGKSYILRQIILELYNKGVKPGNVLYINKEFTDFDFLVNYADLDELITLFEKNLKPKGKRYLLIDEIQQIEGWEKLVNSYSQDFTKKYEIFITGSNSNLLSGELASMLSGRYVEFEVFPFSFDECVSAGKLDKSKSGFMQYLKTGGLPELFHLPNEETKRHYLSALKDTILLRDILQRYTVKDARLLEDIFSFLVNNMSNMVSINSIINYFKSRNRKTNYETIAGYIEYLKNTFLIHQVERYHIKGKEIVSGTAKYYINDAAFKNYLYPGFESGIGCMLENLIYLQLATSGYQVYTGHMRNREVDFVAIKNDRTIYLQSSYLLVDETTIEREYSALEAIPDNHEKFVVSLDEIKFPDRRGIHHVQAWMLSDVL